MFDTLILGLIDTFLSFIQTYLVELISSLFEGGTSLF